MITLTSDFGLKDSYVAEMKGVIMSINPYATIIDITHEINKFDIKMGAFILTSATNYFPKGSIHVAVVDPGVGTDRRSLLVQTKKSFFVGPDNGILSLAAQNQGIEHIYQIENPKFIRTNVSSTFHGRDVFASVAAHLDKGVEPKFFGPEISNLINPEFTKTVKKNDGIIGEVLHIDNFGNIITNIKMQELFEIEKVKVRISNQQFELVLARTYGQVKTQHPLALIGSHNFLEIAVNQGNAAKKYNIKIDDEVEVTPV